MTDRFRSQLRRCGPAIRTLLGRVPLLPGPSLPADWLRCEMFERLAVLRAAPLRRPSVVLEVGAGPHAIGTVPLAYRAGPKSRIVAVERARWGSFRAIVAASGMAPRVRPLTSDAGRLPLGDDVAELAVCIHGIRSLGGEPNIVRVVREMLRVAPRALLAESLPTARSDAQRAHLAMYGLREEVLLAVNGARDDLRYLPLERLVALAQEAGASVETSQTLEVDLPHFLGYFPRAVVESIPEVELREDLLRRWEVANSLRERYGEDHPPVGIVVARRP